MRLPHAHPVRERWLTGERLLWAVLVGMNIGVFTWLFTR